MAAKAGAGGSAGRTRAKNQAMAARMKAENVERTTGTCPMCNKAVPRQIINNPGNFLAHIMSCKGARSAGR